jgi:hypothetical protein
VTIYTMTGSDSESRPFSAIRLCSAFLILATVLASTSGVSCTTTYMVAYPPADDLYVTSGDDPGTESDRPYIPKGYFYYRKQQGRLPIPILGLIPLGNADVDYVVHQEALPMIRSMGADALINASIDYTKCSVLFGLFIGCLGEGDTTTVKGTAVLRQKVSHGGVVKSVVPAVSSPAPTAIRPAKAVPSAGGTDVVDEPGCRTDSECPLGQVCKRELCECVFGDYSLCKKTAAFEMKCLAGAKAKTFLEDGLRVMKCVTSDGRTHGPFQGRYSSGRRRVIGAYFDNNRHGPWVFWTAAGQVEAACAYSSGRLTEKYGNWGELCK